MWWMIYSTTTTRQRAALRRWFHQPFTMLLWNMLIDSTLQSSTTVTTFTTISALRQVRQYFNLCWMAFWKLFHMIHNLHVHQQFEAASPIKLDQSDSCRQFLSPVVLYENLCEIIGSLFTIPGFLQVDSYKPLNMKHAKLILISFLCLSIFSKD